MAASAEDQAVALQYLGDHDAVGRQLDPVIGLVPPAGLALHYPKVRPAVRPPQDDEVHAAGEEELAGLALDLHFPGEAVGALGTGGEEAQEIGPRDAGILRFAVRVQERHRRGDGVPQLPFPLPALGGQYGVQGAADTAVEWEPPGDLRLVDAELEAPLAPVLVDILADIGDDHLTLRPGHPLFPLLDGKGQPGY